MTPLTQCERCSKKSYAQIERDFNDFYDAASWYIEVRDYFDFAALLYEAYDEHVPDELVETYTAAKTAVQSITSR